MTTPVKLVHYGSTDITTTLPDQEPLATATTTSAVVVSSAEENSTGNLPIAHAVEIRNEDNDDAEQKHLVRPMMKEEVENPFHYSPPSNKESTCLGNVCVLIVCLAPFWIGVLFCLLVDPSPPTRPPTSSPLTSSPLLATVVPLPPTPAPIPTPLPTEAPSLQKVLASLDMERQSTPFMDMIHLVDEEFTNRIVGEIYKVESEFPECEIQVLLVNNLLNDENWPVGYTTKQFATRLFNEWELGYSDSNMGVLVLFLMDLRRIEVEVGVNLNEYMNNPWTTSMLQRKAIPEFKRGQYGFGLYNIVTSIADRLRDIQNGVAVPYHEDPSRPAPSSLHVTAPSISWDDFMIHLPMLLFFGIVIGCLVCNGECESSGDNGSRYDDNNNDDDYYRGSGGGGGGYSDSGGGGGSSWGGGQSNGGGGGGASW